MNAKELTDTLEWRYATKVFDPSRQIPAADWAALLEALRLSPSSLGLQMWKFIDVQTPALREQLKTCSWNQGQVTDASHYVVFCARKDFTPADAQRHLERIAAVRGVTMESLEGYRQVIMGLAGSKSPDAMKAWIERQVYIALGFMMSAAAELRIDTCPIEGISDTKEYDKLLGLEDSPYYTLCALALGYRDAEADKYAAALKVRYEPADVVEVR